jgi:hypothetical protein
MDARLAEADNGIRTTRDNLHRNRIVARGLIDCIRAERRIDRVRRCEPMDKIGTNRIRRRPSAV